MMQPWPVSFAQVDQAYCNHLRVKRFLSGTSTSVHSSAEFEDGTAW